MPDEDTERKGSQDADFEAKLEALAEKSKEIKSGANLPEVPEWNYQRPKGRSIGMAEDGQNYLQLGVGLSVAYTLIGAIAAGWGIGKLIDMRTGNPGLGQGIGTLIGAILGLAAALFMIIRAQSRDK